MHLGWVTLSCILGGSIKLVRSLVLSSLATMGRKDGFGELARERRVAVGEPEPSQWLRYESCYPSAKGSHGTQLLVMGRRSIWPHL